MAQTTHEKVTKVKIQCFFVEQHYAKFTILVKKSPRHHFLFDNNSRNKTFSLTDMDLDKYNIHIAIFMYDTWKNTCLIFMIIFIKQYCTCNYIVVWETKYTERKQPTCCKSLTTFISHFSVIPLKEKYSTMKHCISTKMQYA
jgi:hypothetical protein